MSTPDATLAALQARLDSETRIIGGIHYITLRDTGGFGPRVAATLAATFALQDELHAGQSDPRYLAAYPKLHRNLAEFLQGEGERVYQETKRGVV